MTREWGPSYWGRRATKSPAWSLALRNNSVTLESGGNHLAVELRSTRETSVRPGRFWSQIDIQFPDHRATFGGIPNRSARKLNLAIASAVSKYELEELLRAVHKWSSAVRKEAASNRAAKRWLTQEFTEKWRKVRPEGDLSSYFGESELATFVEAQKGAVKKSIAFWSRSFDESIVAMNEAHTKSELVACREFFDSVERSPLTNEQARSVICFDNRVQVVASAGSGKTSTMVAKAGYALHRQLVPPERILMMAFNKDAATELRARTLGRLAPLGLDAEKIDVRTFHGFGLHLIGQATGRKPSLAPWLEFGQDEAMMMRIVDEGRDSSTVFRTQWDLFRMVFATGLPTSDEEVNERQDWDSSTNTAGFRTLNGEMVRSPGERLIADWLFYNGVEYRYEMPYEHDVADASHSQYTPDFYYPAIDAYHEHWAIGPSGKPPASFTGYIEGMAWKRALHQERNTTLLETTSAGLRDGSSIKKLARELVRRGVVLDPDPERPARGRKPIPQADLVRTFRTFLTHAKSNQLNDADLRERLATESKEIFLSRDAMFLELFEFIRHGWEEKLREHDAIDFDDMLNQAADHVESGRWGSEYDLIMVDEMQDASHARARLARALVNGPGRHLFAVGDDWQSINRFAGADISVMTKFEAWFGTGKTLRLERTFRSPQSLCDISSDFVTKNPGQLSKEVKSSCVEYPPTLRAIAASGDSEIAGVIHGHLSELNDLVLAGIVPTNAHGKVTVDILGRYRQDKKLLPRTSYAGLEVTFRTIHGAKGLEADYVVIPGLTSGVYGFPSTMIDDPVLRLAMPDGDEFPLAEERRLFYVALTRARRSVLLITVANKESTFLIELIKDGAVQMETTAGELIEAEVCAKCGTGLMVEKSGKFGPFLACNQFPKCRNTRNLKAEPAPQTPTPSSSDPWSTAPPAPRSRNPRVWHSEEPPF